MTSRNADYLLNNKDSKVFIHKQTTANTYRFTNDDLASLVKNINTSSLKISELEFKIFNELKNKVLAYESDIRSAADSIGELDFFLSLGLFLKKKIGVNQKFLIIMS